MRKEKQKKHKKKQSNIQGAGNSQHLWHVLDQWLHCQCGTWGKQTIIALIFHFFQYPKSGLPLWYGSVWKGIRLRGAPIPFFRSVSSTQVSSIQGWLQAIILVNIAFEWHEVPPHFTLFPRYLWHCTQRGGRTRRAGMICMKTRIPVFPAAKEYFNWKFFLSNFSTWQFRFKQSLHLGNTDFTEQEVPDSILYDIWLTLRCWGNSSIPEGRFSKWF